MAEVIWTRPEVTEIKMDAEIGSYQLDDEDRGDGIRTASAARSAPTESR